MKLNIFTYLTGYYRTELYERFAGSLFDTGFSGTLYLFIHEKDYHCLSLLPKELQDKIYFVTCPEQMQNKQDNINDDTVEDNEQTIHPGNFRYLLYLSFLQQNKQKKNEYSLFCDSKDVLFQRNPEEYIIDDNIDMMVFQEDTSIKDCYWNMSYFDKVKSAIDNVMVPESLRVYARGLLYGTDVPIQYTGADSMPTKSVAAFNYSHYPAISSGTTLVKNSALYYFLNTFCEYMMEYNLNTQGSIGRGLHNFLIYNKLYHCNVRVVDNKNELVYTAGYDKNNAKLDDNNQILNSDNKVPYIVHQYDRLDPSILDQISTKYEFNAWGMSNIKLTKKTKV